MNKKLKALYFVPMLVFVLTAFLFAGCGSSKTIQYAPMFSESGVVVDHEAKTITVTRFADKPLEYSKDNGEIWQTENIFTDLTVGETYQIVIRYAETDEYYASDPSSAVSVTIKEVVAKPTFADDDFTFNTSEKERLSFTCNNPAYNLADLQFRCRRYSKVEERWLEWDSWGSMSFSKYLIAGDYQVEIRFKETDTKLASPSSDPFSVIVKTKFITSPNTDSEDYEVTTDTITIIKDYVYDSYSPSTVVAEFAITTDSSVDDSELEWTTEKVFTGLQADTVYYIHTRWKADEYNMLCDKSASESVRTLAIDRSVPVLNAETVIVDVQAGTVTINLPNMYGAKFKIYKATSSPSSYWETETVYDFNNGRRGFDYYIIAKYDSANGYASTEESEPYKFSMPRLTYNLTWDESYVSVDAIAKTITFTAPTGEYSQGYLYYTVGAVDGSTWSSSDTTPVKYWVDGHIYTGAQQGQQYKASAVVHDPNSNYETWRGTVIVSVKSVRNITLSSETDGNVVIDETNSTVTINVTISDDATIEYYLDEVKQDSNTFAITPNKAHIVYIKILENDTYIEFTSNKLEIANGLIDLEFTQENVVVKGRIITVVGLPEGTLISFDGGDTWGTATTRKVKSKDNMYYHIYAKRDADSKYNELSSTLVPVRCWDFILPEKPNLTDDNVSYDAETKTITVSNVSKIDFSEYGVELDDYEIQYRFKPSNKDWSECEWTTDNTFTVTDNSVYDVRVICRFVPTTANEGQFSGDNSDMASLDIV